MPVRRFWIALLAVLSLRAQDLRKLPAWAETAARAVAGAPMPDADAWVVLNRTEMAYLGGGRIRTRTQRLVKILSERGLDEAGYVRRGLGGKASKVENIRGWNLRPDNELVRLEEENVVTLGTSSSEKVSSGTATVAALTRAAKGSWIAFESVESFRNPAGPYSQVAMLEARPVRCWELLLAKQGGLFKDLKDVRVVMDLLHASPWLKSPELSANSSLRITDLPPVPDGELYHPPLQDVLPLAVVRFLDPELKDAPSAESWDKLAAWFFEAYRARYAPQSLTDIQGREPLAAMKSLRSWIAKEIVYKQVYLTPDRGWVPERAQETVRKRYGDCKDLATCFLSELQAGGLRAYPVLGHIVDGTVDPAGPVSPFAFNHVFAAVKLDKSLGLASEVETPVGRFLLVDLTERLVPLGYLSSAHRNRAAMICLESGAQWVKIPTSAIQAPSTRIRIQATVGIKGDLDAELHVEEEGDALGLRSACLNLGAARMREYILGSLLDLPPSGGIEVLEVGTPLDVSKPFNVRLKLAHPEGFSRRGGEGVLVPWGLPSSLPTLGSPGKPRRLPISIPGMGRFDYQATIAFPWIVTPVLPSKQINTAIRRGEWTVLVQNESGKSRAKIIYSQQLQDVEYGYSSLDAGLSICKKDRQEIKSIVNDGLAFVVAN